MRSYAWVALLPLGLFFVAACTTVQPATGAATDKTLTVTGEGRVTATPDLANLTLGVSVIRDTVSDAMTSATQSMERVLSSCATVVWPMRTSKRRSSASSPSSISPEKVIKRSEDSVCQTKFW